ncbi:heavy-metal-associated domain-containing protein [Gaetbulibacter sp. NE]|uniref:heavy-metal-associated domain-containing protein n=1 Tax=unclassified Gaetbulibacter TaxID=2625143 RepID=UPI0021CFFCFF|nr:cation transporter [Gaetbulibacter sp. NE]
MKKIAVLITFLMATVTFAQNKNAKASLEVDGVCMMCKDRIEKACIKTKGVKSAIWNVETHELKLIYNEGKTSLDDIKKNIVAVGHDLKDMKATDEAYNSVHPCCKYRDEDVRDDHKDEKDPEHKKH